MRVRVVGVRGVVEGRVLSSVHPVTAIVAHPVAAIAAVLELAAIPIVGLAAVAAVAIPLPLVGLGRLPTISIGLASVAVGVAAAIAVRLAAIAVGLVAIAIPVAASMSLGVAAISVRVSVHLPAAKVLVSPVGRRAAMAIAKVVGVTTVVGAAALVAVSLGVPMVLVGRILRPLLQRRRWRRTVRGPRLGRALVKATAPLTRRVVPPR